MRDVRILLVEDNPDDEALTIDALRYGGLTCPIDVARDGQEALDYIFADGDYQNRARADLPKVVLLDLKLPKIGGHEVLRRIRSDPATTNLPVVILTSSAEESDIARGYEQRVNSYVQKPVDFPHFREAVSTLGVYWVLFNETPIRH